MHAQYIVWNRCLWYVSLWLSSPVTRRLCPHTRPRLHAKLSLPAARQLNGLAALPPAQSLPQLSVSLTVCHEAFDLAATAARPPVTSEVSVCGPLNAKQTSRLAVRQHSFPFSVGRET